MCVWVSPRGFLFIPRGTFPIFTGCSPVITLSFTIQLSKYNSTKQKSQATSRSAWLLAFLVLLLGARPHWTAIIGLGCRHNNSALPDRFNCRGVELRFMLASGFHGSFGCGPMKPHTVGILNVGCGFVNTKSQRIRELFYLEIC